MCKEKQTQPIKILVKRNEIIGKAESLLSVMKTKKKMLMPFTILLFCYFSSLSLSNVDLIKFIVFL